MGYGFYFLLAIRSLPKDLARDEESVDLYLEEIVKYARQLRVDWEARGLTKEPFFIDDLGKECLGPASKYSTGGAKEELSPAMETISYEFPEVTFDLYHVSWDYRLLEIYSYLGGKMVEMSRIDHEQFEVHSGVIAVGFQFDKTCIRCNITSLFHEDYGWPFEYDARILG